MIGFLKGFVIGRDGSADAGDGALTLDVNGVGYELLCSSNTIDDIAAFETAGTTQSGSVEIHLWVQTQVREDAITLFGFSTSLEKRMFNSLLKVNGVGPKMAIKILSGARLDGLAKMIEAGDVKALSNLPKVGKKTAEQLILALKGKLVLADDPATATRASAKKKSATAAPAPRFEGPRAAVLSALVNLGFRLPDAERVVGDLPEGIEIETGVRQGLQALTASF